MLTLFFVYDIIIQIYKEGNDIILYCSKCGKQIDDSAVFCKYCGFKMISNEGSTTKYNMSYNGYDFMPTNTQSDYQHQVVSTLDNISNNTGTTADAIKYSLKNKYVAGFLSLFLGVLGIQDFYVGKNGRGFLKLAIFIFDFSIGLIFAMLHPVLYMLSSALEVAMFVWAIIDAIIYFMGRGTDKFGKIVDVPSNHR